MRILITGGRGFIGNYVKKEFERAGHQVTIMSNLSHPSELTKGQEYIYGDVRYQYDCDKAVYDVDCVIHLAAKINVDRSREDARPFIDTNVIGTFNILESCRRFNKKLIYASTSEALGNMQTDGMNEDHPYSPDNPYGASKAAADMLVLGWIKSYDLDATILRSFNVTGIGQSFDKEGAFIPKVIEKVFNGENPQIFGAGQQTRDYVWVGDVAKAYRLLAEGDYSGEVYHTGTGREITIEYIANEIIKISGKDLHIEYIESRPKEVKRLKCDYSKIQEIGWTPTKTIEEILSDMWNYRLMKDICDLTGIRGN